MALFVHVTQRCEQEAASAGWQLARFDLTYRDRDNSNKTPLCIHRAPLGTHERFIGSG